MTAAASISWNSRQMASSLARADSESRVWNTSSRKVGAVRTSRWIDSKSRWRIVEAKVSSLQYGLSGSLTEGRCVPGGMGAAIPRRQA